MKAARAAANTTNASPAKDVRAKGTKTSSAEPLA
jgi:hypothetical protein